MVTTDKYKEVRAVKPFFKMKDAKFHCTAQPKTRKMYISVTANTKTDSSSKDKKRRQVYTETSQFCHLVKEWYKLKFYRDYFKRQLLVDSNLPKRQLGDEKSKGKVTDGKSNNAKLRYEFNVIENIMRRRLEHTRVDFTVHVRLPSGYTLRND